MITRENLQSIYNQHIGLQKAILWEEAKGKLRAMAAAGGQVHSHVIERSPDWTVVQKEVEEFIKKFEEDGLHE